MLLGLSQDLAIKQSNLYERQAISINKTTNFQEKLPATHSQLAQEIIKDLYKFHFLSLGNEALEKDVHQGLLHYVKDFLMELGHGFAHKNALIF